VPANDNDFEDDPRGLVCNACVARPRIIERNRQRRAEAARKLAIAAGRRPPKQPKVGPPKRPKFFRTQREEDDWNHLHGAPVPKRVAKPKAKPEAPASPTRHPPGRQPAPPDSPTHIRPHTHYPLSALLCRFENRS
jgi:hypothetical protein